MASTRSTSPPKSAWPGRIDDVDAIVAPGDRGVLRQNRDAALALQIIRIHDPLLQILARIERAGLAQQLIDERGLAMIDVRDDGDIAKFLSHSEALRETAHYRAFMQARAVVSVLDDDGNGKDRVSVISSCLSETVKPSSRTPSALGVTLTVWRYTAPASTAGKSTGFAPGATVNPSPGDLQLRGARGDLRHEGNVDVERLPDHRALRQIEFQLDGQLRLCPGWPPRPCRPSAPPRSVLSSRDGDIGAVRPSRAAAASPSPGGSRRAAARAQSVEHSRGSHLQL